LAPWQSAKWLEERRANTPANQFARQYENRWVHSESSFLGDIAKWDACVDQRLGHAVNDPGLAIFVGVDVGLKHDQTAIVAVTFDQKAQQVRLVFHRVFQPHPDDPLDFETTVERTLLELRERFCLVKVVCDPWQMASTMQRLRNIGIPIEEFPQSSPNLTAASQNLYELIVGQNLVVYPDEQMRLAISRAIATETPRGWRISKQHQSHKIDVVVALAMAALAAVRGKAEDYYDYSGRWIGANEVQDPRTYAAQQLYGALQRQIMMANSPRNPFWRW
jgi:phage terminase large subunit-like protein